MRVIAHRGNSIAYPENTMEAFRSAAELGVDMIEFDVWLSADGEAVVIHDETVDRTTSGHANVAGLDLCELQRLGVPSLRDVLSLDIALNAEIKDPRAAERVVELAHARPKSVVSSFHLDALDHVRRLNPWQAVAYLCESVDWHIVLQKAVAAGAVALNPPADAVTPRLVDRVHAAGLEVMAFTVNDADLAVRFESWGVDAIFTDDPATMLSAIRSGGSC